MYQSSPTLQQSGNNIGFTLSVGHHVMLHLIKSNTIRQHSSPTSSSASIVYTRQDYYEFICPSDILIPRLKQFHTTHPLKSLLFDVTLYCPLQLKQLSLMDSLIPFINISKENLHFLKTSSFAPSLQSVLSEVLSSTPSGQDDYCGALKCNCVSFVDTYSSCHCLSV